MNDEVEYVSVPRAALDALIEWAKYMRGFCASDAEYAGSDRELQFLVDALGLPEAQHP